MSVYSIDKLIEQTRRLAVQYRQATGKPLPVTSEIANYDAARLLDLELVGGTPGGYEALGRGSREGQRIQIKGRVVLGEGQSRQRIGQLKLGQDWDLLVVVLLDGDFQPTEIYEAERETVEEALGNTQERDRRGAMSVARLKRVARLAWRRP